jgi:hypothetical protein
MSYIPSHKTVHCICRKDRPTLRTLERSGVMWCYSYRSPTIFPISSSFICSRFINEYELVCSPISEFTKPCCPQLRVSLSSSYLHLQIRISAERWGNQEGKYRGKGYLFFGPSHTFEQPFNGRNTHRHIKCIPQIVYLLIDVSRWTGSKIF